VLRMISYLFILLFSICSVQQINVLVVLPSQSWLRCEDGNMLLVGTYLDEAMVPVMKMLEYSRTHSQKFQLTFTTPQGNGAIVDQRSNHSSYFDSERDYLEALNLWTLTQRPVLLTNFAPENPFLPFSQVSIKLESFDALFVPGGHAPLIDLWTSTALGRIISYFSRSNKTLGLICHGPVVLATTALCLQQKFLFVGYNMTVFDTVSEKQNENHWGFKLGFYPEEVLLNLGGNVIVQPPRTPHAIVDRNLVTGQNPQSAYLFADLFVNTVVRRLSLDHKTT